MAPSLLGLAECLLVEKLKEKGWGWAQEHSKCPGEEVGLHPESPGLYQF